MSFWKQHMPEGMCLRSAPDWHLDAAGVHTFEAFLEEEGIAPNEVDPVPIRVFLDYATWFQDHKGVVARESLVTQLTHNGKKFEALLDNGEQIPPKQWSLRLGFVTSSSFLRGPIHFRPELARIPVI